MPDKIYHIYAKDQCIYHSLSEQEFKITWDMINKFLSVSGVLSKSDVTYEELSVLKEAIINSSY
jgi:hypothetical protein